MRNQIQKKENVFHVDAFYYNILKVYINKYPFQCSKVIQETCLQIYNIGLCIFILYSI